MLRLGQTVAEFKKSETNQREVIEAITAGELKHLPGVKRRWSHDEHFDPDTTATAARPEPPPEPPDCRRRPRISPASGSARSARASSARCRSSSGSSIIAIYFQARNSNFLTAGNFVNLLAQMSAVTIIGMGVVFVLLLGEIDLSVGYVSGMGGVIAALLLEPGKGIPTVGGAIAGARHRGGDRPAPGVVRRLPSASPRSSSRSQAC